MCKHSKSLKISGESASPQCAIEANSFASIILNPSSVEDVKLGIANKIVLLWTWRKSNPRLRNANAVYCHYTTGPFFFCNYSTFSTPNWQKNTRLFSGLRYGRKNHDVIANIFFYRVSFNYALVILALFLKLELYTF